MSKMKHLLKKLHIGGGGAENAGDHHQQQQRLSDPTTDTHPSASSSSSSSAALPLTPSPIRSSAADSAELASTESTSAESASAGAGNQADPQAAMDGFSFFEEEYQVQLALALSASDPYGLEDPDSVQMQAAKRMSLGCPIVGEGGDGGGGGGKDMDYLSLQYWNYNVVDYDEKLTDGFYDVYSITPNSNFLDEMPSLAVLQSTSVAKHINYEVVIVNRAIDQALQQLEKRAVSIALETRAAQVGPIASGLVQKISDLVVDNMGGPVGNADDILRRWAHRRYELRTSMESIVHPLGALKVGLSRHRSLLFKVLADRINLPCRLVKGSYCTGTDEGAVNLIKDCDSEYIVDLMGAPGTIIPAEKPTDQLQNSGSDLLCSSTIGQTVKDLCSALDKVSCQFEKKNEVSEETSSANNTVSDSVNLQSEDKSRYELVDLGQTEEVASPSQQMKVNDVSKYVVDAAKNPDFAQKLHAVLLESGASPPPDLFSDLNPSQKSEERKGSKDNLFVEIKGEKKVVESFQDERSLYSQPFFVASTDMNSSNWEDVINVIENDKNHRVPMDANTILPISRQKQIINAPASFGSHCSQKFGENITDGGASEHGQLKDCQVSDTGPMEKCIGSRNNEFRILTSPKNNQVDSILVDVAEWEIPWEDLHFGERIGLGSYGEVYHADWNGTEVAVKKFLNQDLSGDVLEQIRCEVNIMLRLRHPNVVLFMGAVTRPPNLSILTEFLPRGSLFKLLHRTNVQLDEKRRLKMALDVARGMNYLHASHPTIVHRDLKSPNLLVDKNWVVKVCDFGLSRLKHHTFLSSKSTAGTPEWMAPEVLRNEPSNEKCDIYSFGVILWELATLRMPWSGLNPMQVVGAVGFQNKRLDIPKEVDLMVAKIISDCWESDPNHRPSFAQLMPPLKQLRRLIDAAS